jgi:DNA-binding LacI/PurR family transcriptional regulator
MAAIQEAGLRVPDDIAVMGFDGLAEGVDTQPPLATVTQPVADLGREAVRMLLSLVDDPDRAPMQRFLPTELTTRRSCGCAVMTATEGGGVQTETVLSIA